MGFNAVNFCNSFIYFLFMNFGEGEYQTFRENLRDSDERVDGVKRALPFFYSFISNLADMNKGAENHFVYVRNLRLEVFKDYEPQPIELEINA